MNKKQIEKEIVKLNFKLSMLEKRKEIPVMSFEERRKEHVKKILSLVESRVKTVPTPKSLNGRDGITVEQLRQCLLDAWGGNEYMIKAPLAQGIIHSFYLRGLLKKDLKPKKKAVKKKIK